MKARRALAAWAVAACAFAAASTPASASTRGTQLQADAFQFAVPSVPFRDAVIDQPTRAMARSMASASATRYPVNDGHNRSVEIDVSLACQLGCTDASPTDVQNLATFLGSVIHGDEMNSAVISVVTPAEIATQCGSGALSCYYPSSDLIVLNGNSSTGSDGATRDYVLAHEYGHHVANHRNNLPFAVPALDTGPKNWATYERVCEGTRAGLYYPGAEDLAHYYKNPGEAWAEAFAQHRFPGQVRWEWDPSLTPDANAFQAMDRDVLKPWSGPIRTVASGALRPGRNRVTTSIATPLDGTLTLKLTGPKGADFDLILRDPSGKNLASSTGGGSSKSISFTICGQTRVRALLKRGSGSGRFQLVELVP